MALPTAEEFAEGLYTDQGKALDPVDPMIVALVKQFSTVTDAGVPQIQIPIGAGADPADTAARLTCGQVANDFALANPELAKKIGAIGLYKIAFACTAEKKGEIGKGYTQEVVAAMSVAEASPWWLSPALWIGLAGGAVVAFFFFRRGKYGLHGLRAVAP